jgi:hypothetical protein
MALIIREKNQINLLHRYVMIFSAMAIPEDKWLTSKEREFFIEFVLAVHNNVVELPKYFKENTTFTGKSYYVYLTKVTDKGWIKGNSVHPNFDFSNKDIPDELNFNFKLCGITD